MNRYLYSYYCSKCSKEHSLTPFLAESDDVAAEVIQKLIKMESRPVDMISERLERLTEINIYVPTD